MAICGSILVVVPNSVALIANPTALRASPLYCSVASQKLFSLQLTDTDRSSPAAQSPFHPHASFFIGRAPRFFRSSLN